VTTVTLKSVRELPKLTDVGAKIDYVSVFTLKSDIELQKPIDVGAKIDDSAKIDSVNVDICTDLLSDYMTLILVFCL